MELPDFTLPQPKFLNIDDEIRTLTEATNNHAQVLEEIRTTYDVRTQDIQAKINALTQKLQEVREERFNKLSKANETHRHNSERLHALKEQRKRDEENKDLDEILSLIKEITADFAAWQKAREYQVEDVVQIVQQYMLGSSGVLNANEMALGKTFESLVALKIIIEIFKRKHNKLPTMLWLSKVSIIETGGTFNEAKRWFPELRMFPIRGGDNKAAKDMVMKLAANGGVCVLSNYEMVKNTPRAQQIHWDIVVMDEVHKLKGGANSTPTAIWEAVKDLKRSFCLMLSGTPAPNRTEEVWAYLHIFDPVLFDDSRSFARQFRAFRDLSGKLKFDTTSEKMLKELLKGRLIRRTTHEVGIQLPELIKQDVILQHNPEQGKLYQQMKEKFYIWLDEQGEKALTATGILAQLTRLRQINVLPVINFKFRDEEKNVVEEVSLNCKDSAKLDEALDIIQQTNDQCLIFSNFNEPMEEMALRLQMSGVHPEIISSKYSKEMSTYETGFQQGKIDVLLINIKMGEGLNLHKDTEKWPGGARAVIFFDEWWNNAINDQCLKRAWRPGKNDGEPVFCYKLMVENSVDYFIRELCEEKDEHLAVFTESKELRPAREWKEYLKGKL